MHLSQRFSWVHLEHFETQPHLENVDLGAGGVGWFGLLLGDEQEKHARTASSAIPFFIITSLFSIY